MERNQAIRLQRAIIPIAKVLTSAEHTRQRWRYVTQSAFFVLFVLAPVFDVVRYDLATGHAWFLGVEWHAGLESLSSGSVSASQASWILILSVFLPILGAGALILYVAWRWGRLYCGWLCPHFSAVETINLLMRRASGKYSIWDTRPLPPLNPDGSSTATSPVWWIVTVPVAIAFAFAWSVVFLTYLWPPLDVYRGLLQAELSRNQSIFLLAGTVALSMEFLFARHLFCQFACAVGIFQSIAWMSNRKAMVVGFARDRARDCSSCHSACDHACPMRLRPRNIKRFMFSCTQCSQCIDACSTVQASNPDGGLLSWVSGEFAREHEASMHSRGRGQQTVDRPNGH